MKHLTLGIAVSCVALAVSVGVAQAASVPVSSLDLKMMTSGWGMPRADRDIENKPLKIGGSIFELGIGTHAESLLRIDVGGNARRFTAKVGLDDSADGRGSIQFIVLGDRRILWKSAVLKGGQPAVPVDIDLSGVRMVELRVSDAGDGSSYDHGDWADAQIMVKDGAPKPVALPPREMFSVGTATFRVDFSIGDDGRLYQRPIGRNLDSGKQQRLDEAYPQSGDGYYWEPALQVTHADGNTSTDLIYLGVTRTNESPEIEVTRIKLKDPAYPFEATLVFRAHRTQDVIETWTELRHTEKSDVILGRMASTSLLLSSTNLYLTHFSGDWASEMHPTVELLTPGMKVLESKLGVRAHQFGNPSFVLSLGGPAEETRGEVLAGSLEWSGSFQCAFEDGGRNTRALCGINPFESAYHLAPNETFTTPVMLWTWSAHGLGDMSRKLHSWARDFGIRDGHETRAVLLNNWEATGFDFDFNRIAGLFPPAKEIGTELFLLDDGWFGNKYPRVNDHAGLGDWEPNRARLPNGLAPLAKSAVGQGLRFGIWMEPEMVNPRSELFDHHPDWVIRQPKRELELQRNQLVLDLTRPAVQQFEWNTIQEILSVPNITYAKWDCNRYLTQPGSPWLAPDRQTHLWMDYVHALYALMDKTARAFPKTELMLCSGGGGRVDYGALKYFHEFWPSDNTDPVARVPMQWDYSYFFPPMAIASHVTHWGNRPIHFACSVAMSARFGMDLDLTKLSAQDKAICAGAISAYKKIRDVTLPGDLYRLENPHNTPRGALDFVSPDKSRAAVFVFQLKDGPNDAVKPQGLDPARTYVIHELNPAPGRAPIPAEGRTVTGAQLMQEGFIPSCAKPLEACVVELGN